MPTLDQYADVKRTACLGLQGCPVVQADDGTAWAYFGHAARTELVDPRTAKDGSGQQYSKPLPIDVKKVGGMILSAMGVDAAAQAKLLVRWRESDAQLRAQFSQEWVTLDKQDQGVLLAFVQRLIEALGGIPPPDEEEQQ